MKKEKLTITIKQDDKDYLKEISHKNQIPMGTVIACLLQMYKKNEKPLVLTN